MNDIPSNLAIVLALVAVATTSAMAGFVAGEDTTRKNHATLRSAYLRQQELLRELDRPARESWTCERLEEIPLGGADYYGQPLGAIELSGIIATRFVPGANSEQLSTSTVYMLTLDAETQREEPLFVESYRDSGYFYEPEDTIDIFFGLGAVQHDAGVFSTRASSTPSDRSAILAAADAGTELALRLVIAPRGERGSSPGHTFACAYTVIEK